jgi:uncharacterized protein DUF3795
MEIKKELMAPCGLYCGTCAVLIAHRDNNTKLKERLSTVYGTSVEDMHCIGCLGRDVDELFLYCRACPIKHCCEDRAIDGCHQCDDFPCDKVDNFPVAVGKKVILRSVPQRRELGDEKWAAAETKRYACPNCGYALFRGAKKCHSCKEPVDLD